jgi:hypothetical protein
MANQLVVAGSAIALPVGLDLPCAEVDQAGFLRCHEAEGADEQGPLESGGECLRGRGAGGQQVAGAAGRDPAEHRPPSADRAGKRR